MRNRLLNAAAVAAVGFVLLVGTVLVLAVIVVPFLAAKAKEMVIGDPDQAAITQICAAAARSPNLTIEDVANISQWCVQWQNKVRVNNMTTPPPAQTTAPEGK